MVLNKCTNIIKTTHALDSYFFAWRKNIFI